jgi:hypothetical protein
MALDDPPPAPWTLQGEAIVGLKCVASDVARRLVPTDAKVIRIWPGRTLAILFLAHYRQSPVGEYRELIVAPAMIRRQGRIGFWISHILVDSRSSLAAGRTIWALPKQMASMEWVGNRFTSDAPALHVQSMLAPPRGSIRLPFIGAAMSKCGSAESWFAVRGAARVGLSRAKTEMLGDVALGELGFTGQMRVLVCSEMRLTIGCPSK